MCWSHDKSTTHRLETNGLAEKRHSAGSKKVPLHFCFSQVLQKSVGEKQCSPSPKTWGIPSKSKWFVRIAIYMAIHWQVEKVPDWECLYLHRETQYTSALLWWRLNLADPIKYIRDARYKTKTKNSIVKEDHNVKTQKTQTNEKFRRRVTT